MITFENLKENSIDFPNVWTFLWSPEEANQISQEHKDQIFFLNSEASNFVSEYFNSSKISDNWIEPINKYYFKNIEKFKPTNTEELRKWLFNRKIPFENFVFLISDGNDYVVMLTWKMVMKYCEGIFFSRDVFMFDKSLNWALFFYHEDEFTFGSEKNYDKDYYYKKAEINNELKKKYNLE